MLYYSPNATHILPNKHLFYVMQSTVFSIIIGHSLSLAYNCHILIVIKCKFNCFNNWQCTHSQCPATGCCCIFMRCWVPWPWGLSNLLLQGSQCLQATNLYTVPYICDRLHRDARWIGGLSHQSSDLSHLCNLLQRVVIHALLNTGFKGM